MSCDKEILIPDTTSIIFNELLEAEPEAYPRLATLSNFWHKQTLSKKELAMNRYQERLIQKLLEKLKYDLKVEVNKFDEKIYSYSQYEKSANFLKDCFKEECEKRAHHSTYPNLYAQIFLAKFHFTKLSRNHAKIILGEIDYKFLNVFKFTDKFYIKGFDNLILAIKSSEIRKILGQFLNHFKKNKNFKKGFIHDFELEINNASINLHFFKEPEVKNNLLTILKSENFTPEEMYQAIVNIDNLHSNTFLI